MEDNPLISVLVPMKNAELFVSITLDSILKNRQIPIEIIVINDGSTDQSVKIVERIQDSRIRLINGPCRGISAAFNRGLESARGQIITRCDADDIYPPERLINQFKWLSLHQEFGAVCGSFATINDKGSFISGLNCGVVEEEITEQLCQGITRTHFCTFAVRKDLLLKLGGCREYFQTAEDIDLQLRLGEICKVYYLPEISYHYRLHSNSITHAVSDNRRVFFSDMAHYFQEQRVNQGIDSLQKGEFPELPQLTNISVRSASSHIQDQLVGHGWHMYSRGFTAKSVKIAFQALVSDPCRTKYWKSIVLLILKSLIATLRFAKVHN